MTIEPATKLDPEPASPDHRGRLLRGARAAARVILIVAAAIVVWSAVWSIVATPATAGGVVGAAQHVVLPVIVAGLVVFLMVRQEILWVRPLKKLAELGEAARAGKAPIDELTDIRGGIGVGPGVELVQALLRDVREQRRRVNELNEQMRQRVAQRTDALERTIGSLRLQAALDKLTGLYNRRMFDEIFPRLFEQSLSRGDMFSVLMIDVDHFKILNDTLGHAVGDDLLRDIGKLIGSGLRDGDAAFRLGGDEFVVLMPGADAAGATSAADRLTRLVDALAKPMKVKPAPRISVGVASTGQGGRAGRCDTPDDFLKQADRALYGIKGARRRGAA